MSGWFWILKKTKQKNPKNYTKWLTTSEQCSHAHRQVLNHWTTLLVQSCLFQFIFHLLPHRKSISNARWSGTLYSQESKVHPCLAWIWFWVCLLLEGEKKKRKWCSIAESAFPHPADHCPRRTGPSTPSIHSLGQLHKSHFLHVSHGICSPITLWTEWTDASDHCACATIHHISAEAMRAF